MPVTPWVSGWFLCPRPWSWGAATTSAPSSGWEAHTRKGNSAGSGARRGLVCAIHFPQRLRQVLGGQVCRGAEAGGEEWWEQTAEGMAGFLAASGTKSKRQWGLSPNFLHPHPDPQVAPGLDTGALALPRLLMAVSRGSESFRAGSRNTRLGLHRGDL